MCEDGINQIVIESNYRIFKTLKVYILVFITHNDPLKCSYNCFYKAK